MNPLDCKNNTCRLIIEDMRMIRRLFGDTLPGFSFVRNINSRAPLVFQQQQGGLNYAGLVKTR